MSPRKKSESPKSAKRSAGQNARWSDRAYRAIFSKLLLACHADPEMKTGHLVKARAKHDAYVERKRAKAAAIKQAEARKRAAMPHSAPPSARVKTPERAPVAAEAKVEARS